MEPSGPSADAGLVTLWISQLKHGSDQAARRLTDRYFGELDRAASQRLRGHWPTLADGQAGTSQSSSMALIAAPRNIDPAATVMAAGERCHLIVAIDQVDSRVEIRDAVLRQGEAAAAR